VALGSQVIYVEPWLDIEEGDEIALVSQSYNISLTDDRTVTAYNANTGRVDLDEPLDHYHWGQSESTADKYGGVDIRCEVILLTRNVKILGSFGNV